jgi:hypothetical protein
MLRENRGLIIGAIVAGVVLRVFFLVYFPAVVDDSHLYMDLATNWLQHGVYGQMDSGQIAPTDIRLPGYPAFLAAVFWMFGAGNVRAILLAQMLVDLLTCAVIGDLARRLTLSRRAGAMAFALAATCPFLANYSAAVLSETLEIFFTAVALDCLVAALFKDRDKAKNSEESGAGERFVRWRYLAAAGAAIAGCILVRPDGGILLIAAVLYLAVVLWRKARATERIAGGSEMRRLISSFVIAEILIAGVALAPLVPWTMRNFRTLHHFQSLAPRYANEPEEVTPRGFNRWVKTWMAEYTSVQEIYWPVQGDAIPVEKLPARALDEPGREQTLALIAEYNESKEMTAELDEGFAKLAGERIRAHPVRYYIELPVLRIADMWLRPRTELLPPDPRWWEFNDEPRESALAVGFGILNLAYLGMAGLALAGKGTGLRYLRYFGLLGGFLLLRSVFLSTIENPESRYTLECFPVILAWAGAFLGGKVAGIARD